jgi:hypothetical protein
LITEADEGTLENYLVKYEKEMPGKCKPDGADLAWSRRQRETLHLYRNWRIGRMNLDTVFRFLFLRFVFNNY